MTDFKQGDRVVIFSSPIPGNDRWFGREFSVVDDPHLPGNRIRLEGGPRPDGFGTSSSFTWARSGVRLVKPVNATIDDLRVVVDSLREQGYTIDISVTEPPVQPKTYTL